MCVTNTCNLSAMEVPLEHQLVVFWELSPGQHREHFGRIKRSHGSGPCWIPWFTGLSWTCWQRPVGGWKRYDPCKILTADSTDGTIRRLWKEQWCQGEGSVKRKFFPAEAWVGGAWKFVLLWFVLGRWRAGVGEKDGCSRQGNDKQGWYRGCDREKSKLRQFEWSWDCFRLRIKNSVGWEGAVWAQSWSSLVQQHSCSRYRSLSAWGRGEYWVQLVIYRVSFFSAFCVINPVDDCRFHTQSSAVLLRPLAACLECRAGEKPSKEKTQVLFLM